MKFWFFGISCLVIVNVNVNFSRRGRPVTPPITPGPTTPPTPHLHTPPRLQTPPNFPSPNTSTPASLSPPRPLHPSLLSIPPIPPPYFGPLLYPVPLPRIHFPPLGVIVEGEEEEEEENVAEEVGQEGVEVDENKKNE